MTLYAWDASHYDGWLSRAILNRAHAEGISIFTHKIGEGTSDTEGAHDDTALAAARDAGIPFLGGYYVVRSGSVGPQVDTLLTLCGQGEPWWRTFPGWFWQVDLERWPQDSVSAATGIAFGQLLRQRTGRAVIIYASAGQYGNSLAGWDGPLWNANYPSSRQAPFRDLYPGTNGPGWRVYSNTIPALWQYSSSATIAGLSTCDASAYQGTVANFAAMIRNPLATQGVSTVELNDQLTTRTNLAGRSVGQVLADVSNLRDGLIGAGELVPGAPVGVWPHPDSILGRLLAVAEAPVPGVSHAALVTAVVEALLDPAVRTALVAAAREGANLAEDS